MKTIKVNNIELLLVPVPICDYYMISNIQVDNDLIGMSNDSFSPKYIKTLPYESYKIVNTLSKLTEKQAKELVEKQIDGLFLDYVLFRGLQNYTETALESFNSLMIANEIDINNEYLILIKY